MSKTVMTVKDLLSKKTVEKLDNALTKGNMEQLKKQMEKLFTFKNIFNLHDSHLIELVECIVDLAEAEDILECARGIEKYAQKRMARYQERKTRVMNENQWAKAAHNTNKVEMLDLSYKLWVYESGFQYSKFHMYTILCHIIHDIFEEYEKECTK